MGGRRAAGTETDSPLGELIPAPGSGSVAAAGRVRNRKIGAYLAAGALLFLVYLRLSMTSALNSDSANILLAGDEMLHGNLLLHGWYASDVSFYSTEIPQYALLVGVFGLRASTAHIAAAMTYTLAFLLAVALARAGARDGRQALIRTLIAGGIMLAPALGDGVFALDLSVGHVGTAVPLLVLWIILDRTDRIGVRRWQVPVAVAVLLAWVQLADPIVLAVGIAPLGLAAAVRLASRFRAGGLRAGGPRDVWYEASLLAAAVAAYGLAWVAEQVLRALGGYRVNVVSYHLTPVWNPGAARQVLEIFGANAQGLTGFQLVLAYAHLASVLLVAAALLVTAWRFGSRSLIDQALALAVAANIGLFLFTSAATLPKPAHEVAIVVPFGAALAARMLSRPQPRSGWLTAAGWLPAAALATGSAVLAGYTAGLAWDTTRPAQPMTNVRLADWLAARHLDYGLSGYWTSSSVTVDSRGTVDVRALMQFTMKRDLWMSDERWYDPGRHYANFIVLDSDRGFFSHWEPTALISKYFGHPARTYRYGPYTILVWDRNLLPEIPGSLPPAR